MTKPTDDLEAVRVLVQALEPFDPKDRERIIRWSCEKLGMASVTIATSESAAKRASASPHAETRVPASSAAPEQTPSDIKTFIHAKNPKSENHLAAVVAYYYHFAAPPAEKRDTITKEDLIEACRQADWKRPNSPAQVLVNTFHAGLLDKAERGQYRLNSVGENLVAMVLPETEGISPPPARKRRKIKRGKEMKPPRKRTRRKKTTRRKGAKK